MTRSPSRSAEHAAGTVHATVVSSPSIGSGQRRRRRSSARTTRCRRCSSSCPGSKQAWPNSAACWSPAMPLIGMPAPSRRTRVVGRRRSARSTAAPRAARPSARRTGRTARRTSRRSRMSNSIVRLALDGVGGVHRAAGQVPQQPRVDRAEREVGRRRSTPPSVSSHSIFEAEKYGSSTRPVVRADQRQVAGVAQLVAARRRAPVLPDDGPVAAARPVRAVPGDDRLALVGDADGGDRLASSRSTQLGRASPARPRPRSRRRRARPSPGAGKCWVNSRYGDRPGVPGSSTAKARTPVVPASMATTTVTTFRSRRARTSGQRPIRLLRRRARLRVASIAEADAVELVVGGEQAEKSQSDTCGRRRPGSGS